ncbi:non-receptor tyrosine-protein kinase TYK2-like, partial [Malurus melanocephalus]|uniref:non-receptor tyrosine-protein kinase TYK2-like n=1 Tax=Malurus melanocephalus TaxID=175006 RepID=UPI002548C592
HEKPGILPPQLPDSPSLRGYLGRKGRIPGSDAAPDPPWSRFCDFREITHVVLRQRRLSVHRHDNQSLEFVFSKLRREEPEDGLYVLRWSVLDFNRLILSVAKRSPEQAPGAPASLTFRQFRIQSEGDSFTLEGWDRSFPSLRELLQALHGCTL